VFQLHSHHELFKGEDEDELPTLTLVTSIAALAAITACVTMCSE
jgi:Ca2+:H+ antiporter